MNKYIDDYPDRIKCHPDDVFIKWKLLEGGGLWFIKYVFQDVEGMEYEIWFDTEGDSKVVEA